MKHNYFYSAAVDSAVGKKLVEFVERCQRASEIADEFVKNCGAAEYIENPLGMAGGVASIIMPEGAEVDEAVWKPLELDTEGAFYVPNVPDDFDHKAARERDHDAEPLTIAESIELARIELPIVMASELADVLGIDYSQNVVVKHTPAFFRYQPKPDTAYPEQEKWYIMTSFPCKANGIVEISEKLFIRKRMAAINTR